MLELNGPSDLPDRCKGISGMAAGSFVSGGAGGIDDIPALLTRGEYVWDRATVDKYGWLISMLHNAKGFQGGGPTSSLDTKGAQVDTIAVAEAAQKLFGINDIGMFRSADGYNEHASGEAADVMVGGNKSLGDQVAQYFLQNAGQFGVQYVLWQQTQMNPDGSSSKMEDRGGATANHMDHVHVRTVGGGFPAGADTSGFAAPSSGATSGTPSPVAMMSVGGPGSMSKSGFPGMPGQYGGGGAYGGQTADQAYQTATAVQSAKDRLSDTDWQIKQKQEELDKAKKDLVGTMTKDWLGHDVNVPPDATKTEQINSNIEKLGHELEVLNRNRGEQGGALTEAERKQQESSLAPPGKGVGQGKVTGEAAFQQLGSGLLKGIASDLGFGDIFAKSPMDWGIVKLATGLASWGIGTANVWADEIGKGHTGMTGNQPIPGWNAGSGGGGAASGLLSGMMPSLSGLMPKNVSAGSNIKPGQGISFGQGTGPAPGPVVQGDYQPINITQTQPDTKQIMGPVQDHLQSSQFTNSGGFPPP
jgi:hypothetical protein